MIGLKEAIQATYDELTAAAADGADNGLMRFRYSSIELEMTIAMSDSKERQGGLKVWVLDGFRKRIRGKTSTHTVRVTIQPEASVGGQVAYTVQD
ncbi:trypco2 family protein [Streptomyces hirsutus]|uniref:trypco2 family protein n=1 Tax=Streptomyces hirsutus TaxID=35620 RepID=UPI00364007B2